MYKKILLNSSYSPIGWSVYQSYMTCPQKMKLSYIDRLRPEIKSKALTVGSMVHLALAHYYVEDKERFYSWQEALLEEYGDKLDDEFYQMCMTEAKRVMDIYKENLESEFLKESKVVSVEQIVKTKEYPAVITARIDLVVEINNKIYFVDHKTMSRERADQKEYFESSGQFLGHYLMGVDLYGDRFGGILINQIKLTKEIVSSCYALDIPTHLLSSFIEQIQWTYKKIFFDREFPKRISNNGSCYTIYGRCDHYERCYQKKKFKKLNTEQEEENFERFYTKH